ncbi:MAG: heavy metal-associated domain-containing protein [Chloroflexi bacterium 13_1_20CM_54_36]|nr:MAG: heavy metal-associated domain-containing protein [Chloroflexi bacterium 13_1_20CM_54_36]
MTYYALLFIAGFAGSFHCIGMCGGFACALGGDPRGAGATSVRHALYNTGRLTTYCFVGGLAGGLGQAIYASLGAKSQLGVPVLSESLGAGQRGLAVIAGLLMIIMALQFFGFRGLRRVTTGFGGSTLVLSLRSLLSRHGHAAPLAFGVLNGFLPCPLVYAMVAQAASTVDVLSGCLTMAAFGLGTFPTMLAMGGLGRLLAPRWRQRGVRLAGSFILALGLVTLGRGVVPMAAGHNLHHSLHHIWHFA